MTRINNGKNTSKPRETDAGYPTGLNGATNQRPGPFDKVDSLELFENNPNGETLAPNRKYPRLGM